MASEVNDITIQYEEDGVLIVKELDKEILSKGAWATLLFRYQQWDRRKNEYGADYTITNGLDNIKLSRIIASSIHVGQKFPIPLMVMYKDGKYVTHYVGAIPEEMIESDINQALGR